MRVLIFISFALLVACNPTQDQTSEFQSVIGQDDQVEVGAQAAVLPEWLRDQVEAVGLTNNDCTVFHIGGGVALTAGHCFTPSSQESQVSPCEQTWIKWNHRRGQENELISRCLEIIARQYDAALDYALIQIDPAPTRALELGFNNPLLNADLHGVLGYPNNHYLHWSENCVLAEGASRGWGEAQFSHECDTKAGNSGSPVLNLVTQKVVGIHNGGDQRSNYGTPLSEIPELNQLDGRIPGYLIRPGEQRRFGPFANNVRDVLAVFGQVHGERVNFQIAANIEDGYDQIVLQDGFGDREVLTGEVNRRFEDLKTPVIVIFVSDYAGPSDYIDVQDTYYR